MLPRLLPAAALRPVSPLFRAASHARAPLTQPQVGVAAHIYARLPCGRVDPHHVLLIQRGRPPGLDMWVFPGGRQELGESIAAAAMREAKEEVGLDVLVLDFACPVFTATDVLHHEGEAGLTYHYAILHVLATVDCAAAEDGGALLPAVRASDDAKAAAWVDVSALLPSPRTPQSARMAQAHETMQALQRRGVLVPLSMEVTALAAKWWGVRGVEVWTR